MDVGGGGSTLRRTYKKASLAGRAMMWTVSGRCYNAAMASSFADQIPVVLHLLASLRPASLLDVGKGFGKYGFLAHEYAGVDLRERPDPARTLAGQSRLRVDAVEVEAALMLPHMKHIYGEVFIGAIEQLYTSLPRYDVVLMADVIEHIEKEAGGRVLRHFIGKGSSVIVATPRTFFEQHLCGSEFEEHVSHWGPKDFAGVAPFVDYQNCGAGRVFFLSPGKTWIRGFGNRPIARARRIARLLLSEL
jgi:hypothetical protein